MPEIREVLETFYNLDVNKASDPDGVPTIVLLCVRVVSGVDYPVSLLYELRTSPENLKVLKRGGRAYPYMLFNTMELIVNFRLVGDLEPKDPLSDRRPNFHIGRFTGNHFVYATHLRGDAVEK